MSVNLSLRREGNGKGRLPLQLCSVERERDVLPLHKHPSCILDSLYQSRSFFIVLSNSFPSDLLTKYVSFWLTLHTTSLDNLLKTSTIIYLIHFTSFSRYLCGFCLLCLAAATENRSWWKGNKIFSSNAPWSTKSSTELQTGNWKGVLLQGQKSSDS